MPDSKLCGHCYSPLGEEDGKFPFCVPCLASIDSWLPCYTKEQLTQAVSKERARIREVLSRGLAKILRDPGGSALAKSPAYEFLVDRLGAALKEIDYEG